MLVPRQRVRSAACRRVGGGQSVGRRHARVGHFVAAALVNFDALPVVHGRDPLWEPPPEARPASRRACAVGSARGPGDHGARRRAGPSRPRSRRRRSGPSWPLLATTVLFIGSIFTPWAVVWGIGAGRDRADRLVLAEARRDAGRARPREAAMNSARSPDTIEVSDWIAMTMSWSCKHLSSGIDRRKDLLADLLCQSSGAARVYFAHECKQRTLEGLPVERGFLRGGGETMVEIQEEPARFLVDIERGQKTGWFCDQRENRLVTAPFAAGGMTRGVCPYWGFWDSCGARGSEVDRRAGCE